MFIFYRQNYDELWIDIRASETLGLLSADYVEDYYGVDGQLSLHNMDTGVRTPVPVVEDTLYTPSVPHDAFTGYVLLDGLPDGLYQVEGRVRDVAGNYRILSDFQSPLGTEEVTLFELQISPLALTVRVSKDADVFLPSTPEATVAWMSQPEGILEYASTGIEAFVKISAVSDNRFFSTTQSPEAAILEQDDKYSASVELVPAPELNIMDVYIK